MKNKYSGCAAAEKKKNLYMFAKPPVIIYPYVFTFGTDYEYICQLGSGKMDFLFLR